LDICFLHALHWGTIDRTLQPEDYKTITEEAIPTEHKCSNVFLL